MIADHIPERVRDRVVIEPHTKCWVWIGRRDPRGYGAQIRVGGRDINVHKFVYEQLVGPVPAGLELDHLCRNRACCNPDHLEAVTHRENVLRGCSPLAMQARQTHCKRGHEFTPDNTYLIPSTGSRVCRTCSRARSHHKKVSA